MRFSDFVVAPRSRNRKTWPNRRAHHLWISYIGFLELPSRFANSYSFSIGRPSSRIVLLGIRGLGKGIFIQCSDTGRHTYHFMLPTRSSAIFLQWIERFRKDYFCPNVARYVAGFSVSLPDLNTRTGSCMMKSLPVPRLSSKDRT